MKEIHIWLPLHLVQTPPLTLDFRNACGKMRPVSRLGHELTEWQKWGFRSTLVGEPQTGPRGTSKIFMRPLPQHQYLNKRCRGVLEQPYRIPNSLSRQGKGEHCGGTTGIWEGAPPTRSLRGRSSGLGVLASIWG